MAPASKKGKKAAGQSFEVAVMTAPAPSSNVRMWIPNKNITLDDAWTQLIPGLNAVFNLHTPFSPKKYTDYYTVVYNFCTSANSNRSFPGDASTNWEGSYQGAGLAKDEGPALLSKRIEEFVRSQLAKTVEPIFLALRGDDLLREYTKSWTAFGFSAKVANGFSAYLNDHFLRKQSNNHPGFDSTERYTIYAVFFKAWRDGVLSSIQLPLMRAVSEVITADRNGETTSAHFVRKIVDCLVEMGRTLDYDPEPSCICPVGVCQAGCETKKPFKPATKAAKDKEKNDKGLQVYQQFLEKPFLEDTRAFYGQESRDFLESNSVAKYVERVNVRLKEETFRCEKYLDQSTLPKLIEAVENVLITKNMTRLRAEFMIYLAHEKIEELAAMYDLISRVPLCMQELYDAVETHIRDRGLEALSKNPEGMMNLKDQSGPRLFVAAVYEVYKSCAPLIEKSFKKEKKFQKAFDQGFYSFVNKNAITNITKSSNKISELAARYVDSMLKKGAKNLSEADLEKTLEEFMTVFKYIEDKDIFQRHYQKCLCKRLISSLSASDDAEASMISKLKAVAGWEYVTKLQRMFQDITLSIEMNKNFREHNHGGMQDWKFEFNVQVLASGSWPLAPGIGMAVPIELERPLEVFKTFYTNKYNGRKLIWVFPNSRCEISTNCFEKKHILMVSAMQAAIILAFNGIQEPSMTFGEMRTTVGMIDNSKSDAEAVQFRHCFVQFKQIMIILLKSKLLQLQNAVENIDESVLADDSVVIKLNLLFKDKRSRVPLNAPIGAEMKQEEESVDRGVEEDRKAVIQAAIVRIMKMRKELRHQNLIGETMEMLSTRFKPNVSAIKKNIEIMIEKEYIKRNEEERDLYTYVA